MRILFFILLGLAGQTADQQKAEPDLDELLQLVGLPDLQKILDPDEVLRGFDTFSVGVEQIQPGSPVTRAQLQTDIELRLRSLGIAISPRGGSPPYLYIRVSTVPVKLSDIVSLEGYADSYAGWCVNIYVCFNDIATLRSSGKRSLVNVWPTGSTGWVRFNDKAEHAIRKDVEEQVDRFANAWLKTHPKEPATMSTDKTPDTKKP